MLWRRLTILCSLFSLFLISGVCFAADVTVAWNPPADTSAITGYKLYYWVDGVLADPVDVGLVYQSGTITFPDGVRIDMVATSYNDTDESNYSRKLIFDTTGSVWVMGKAKNRDRSVNVRKH